MGKTLTVDMTGATRPSESYNLKGVTTLVIKTKGNNNFLDGIKSVTASGGTFTVTLNTDITGGQDFSVKFTNIADPEKLIVKAYGLEEQSYYYEKTASAFYDEQKFVEARAGVNWDPAEGVTTVTGSVFDDVIKFSNDAAGLNINSGKGNDTITGTKGTDTITGGAGENVIKYTSGHDHIKLTKGETMTLDLSELGLSSENISYTMHKGDVILNLKDYDTVTLDNFVKSNVVGKNGAVQYTLDGENYKSFDDIEMYADADVLTINTKKKTASFGGTRFDDLVEINAEQKITVDEKEIDLKENNYKFSIKDTTGNNEITLSNASNTSTITTGAGDDEITVMDNYNSEKEFTTTIKAGAGKNTVTVDTDLEGAITAGTYAIVTGKDNDTINLNYASDTTIKAGGGENTININTADFGNIILAEEKVKGTKNNIVFDDDIDLADYDFVKQGNDLFVSSKDDEDDTILAVKGQFLSGGKYATKTYNGDALGDFLDKNDLSLYVTGSGTVKGTDLSENIITADAIAGKPKNDKIYAGKGNDKINAGDGKNSIYVLAGDGIDTIENGYGNDTVVFKKGTKYSLSFAETGETTEGGEDIYDLRIYYSKDKSDYVNIKNAITFDGETYHFDKDATSVTAIKVGSKTYKLESLLNRNKIENILTDRKVVGTAKHDDIYVTDHTKFKDAAEVTISGNVGNDYIMIGSNQAIDEENDEYNVDPVNYDSVNITPTVYTHTPDGKQEETTGTYDRIISYADNGGTYWGQSAISDIKVYGNNTNDTYNTYYNNQFTKLYDESGNDVLYIKDKTHSDLKLIFNVTNEYKDWSSEIAKIDKITDTNKHDVVRLMVNSLQEVKIVTSDDRNYFLENQEENNDIGIDIDYWGDKNAHDSEGDFDEKTEALLSLGKDKLAKFGGGVEKIYASDGSYITSDAIAQVASNVASWLTDKGYANVEEVRTAEKTEGDFTALLEVFDNIQWQNSNV